MSKDFKNFEQIRKREKLQALKSLTSDYAEKNNLDDVTAPDVKDSESVINDHRTVETLIAEVNEYITALNKAIKENEELPDKDISKKLRMIKSLCNIGIAKIETGW